MQTSYYYVYILSNKDRGVYYVGVTKNLVRRILEHREGSHRSFTGRYQVFDLMYFEVFDDIEQAIVREKQIKAGPRRRKTRLIEGMNP